MPVLHERADGSGHYLVTTREGREESYTLTEEGERFLTLVLAMKRGDACRVADLNLLLERKWAVLADAEDEQTLSHRDKGAQRVQPAETEAEAPPPPSEPSEAHKPEASSQLADVNRVPASRRTRGREVALQVLYLLEQNPGVDARDVEQFLERRLRDPKLIGFARSLVDGAREHLVHIDGLISGVAENWRLDRMATIDRNILRLGAYELVYCPEVPAKVAINEALELAKRYSTSQSSRFVNGILDRLQGSDRERSEASPNPPERPTPDEPGADASQG